MLLVKLNVTLVHKVPTVTKAPLRSVCRVNRVRTTHLRSNLRASSVNLVSSRKEARLPVKSVGITPWLRREVPQNALVVVIFLVRTFTERSVCVILATSCLTISVRV